MFLRPDESLIVVWCAREVTGRMSRETASNHDIAWSENDGYPYATSLRRREAAAASLG